MRAASINLYDLTRAQLRDLLVSWDLKPVHAAQLWNYLYLGLADSLDRSEEHTSELQSH